MRAVSIIAIAVALSGCAEGGMERCRVGAECRSGVCRSDGTCEAERSDAGGDRDAGADDAASIEPDAAIESDASVDVDGGARVCSANGDGTIERSEVPLRAGLYATFRVAEDATVDSAGTRESDGSRTWNMSGAIAGESDVRRDLIPLAGTWYETEFPGAGWAARLSESEDLLGVFEITDDALLLRGVVSPDDGLYRTLLTYDPAVVVLQFPLRAGDSWTTRSTVSGTALGVASYYTETYASSVDASGTLIAPFGTFENVHRVRTTLDRLVGALPTRIRSFAYVAECFGTVATITSDPNETDTELTHAAEVSRLSP